MQPYHDLAIVQNYVYYLCAILFIMKLFIRKGIWVRLGLFWHSELMLSPINDPVISAKLQILTYPRHRLFLIYFFFKHLINGKSHSSKEK